MPSHTPSLTAASAGVPWRYLPHDFPPWQSVYGYFAHWQNDGVFDRLNGLLRSLLRQAEGREPEPTACPLNSQSIKTSATVHLADQGIDPAKKIIGRKRHIATDPLGLLLAVLVTAASVHESAAGTHLIDHLAARHPRHRPRNRPTRHLTPDETDNRESNAHLTT